MEAHPRTQTGPRTLGRRMGAELSASLVSRCSETPAGLRGAVASRLMKPRNRGLRRRVNWLAGRLGRVSSRCGKRWLNAPTYFKNRGTCSEPSENKPFSVGAASSDGDFSRTPIPAEKQQKRPRLFGEVVSL